MKATAANRVVMFDACPACGAGVKEHKPKADGYYETWRFFCDGLVMKMDNGLLTAEDPCENALRVAILGHVGSPADERGEA